MTLLQLEYFYQVAKLQHFRRASKKLNISQPSLTKSIQMLESELGLELFSRKGRNVELNKYGKIFLEHAEKILNEVSISKKRMTQLGGKGGTVDLAYVFPLSYRYIPKNVRKFLDIEENKNINFNFHQSYTKELIDGIHSDRYDVIFCAYKDNEPDIEFVPIVRQRLVIITSPDHPLSNCDQINIVELNNYPVIGYDKNSGLGKVTKNIYESYGINPNIICESPDENAIASLVAENFGIALAPEIDFLKNHKLKVHPIADINLYHTVYLAYKKNYYLSQSVRKFIDFIKKEGNELG